MLTLADMGGGGLFEMLTSVNILNNHGNIHLKLLNPLNSTKSFPISWQNLQVHKYFAIDFL